LLEVIDLYKRRMPVYDAADGRPWILRHSQGDQWDLMLIFPVASLAQYYGAAAQARRAQAAVGSALTDAQFDSALAERTAWREEVFVQGPPLAEASARMGSGSFYHVEMFVALAGRYRDLKREREMEGAYQAWLGRPQNLLFTRVAGAAWDMFTVGVYRDIKHFAESADIPPARQDSAARAAGFSAPDQIGPYLRTLIGYHHDTLAGAVKP
jgi:hypothetical protein